MPDVRLPDGSIARFPDGMPPAQIEAAIRQHTQGPTGQGVGTRPRSAGSRAAGVGRAAAQSVANTVVPMVIGVTPGGVAGNALRSGRMIANTVGAHGAASLLDSAANTVDPATPAYASLPQNVPQGAVERNVQRYTGFGVNALLPGSLAARAASVALPVAGGMIGRRLGGDVGEMVGEFAGGVATAIRRPADLARRAARAVRNGPNTGNDAAAAAEMLRQRGGAGAADPVAMRARAAEMRANGVTPTAVDTTNNTGRRTIRAVASGPDNAQNTAAEYNQTLNDNLPGNISRHARRIISPGLQVGDLTAPGGTRTITDPAQMTEHLTTTRDQRASVDYAPFQGQPIQIPDAISTMLTDSSGRSIIGRAMADAVENQDWTAQAELQAVQREAVNGRLPMVSAGTLDRLSIAARERGAGFAEAGRRYRARGAFQRQSQINGLLDGVPELAPARANYAEGTRQMEAVDHGSNFLDNNNPDQMTTAYNAMSPEANNVARASAARAVEVSAGTSTRGALGTADQLSMRPGANQTQIANALLGRQDTTSLGNAMRLEARRVRNAQDVNPRTGSGTQMNTSNANRVASGIQTAISAVRDPSMAFLAWMRTRGINPQDAERITTAIMDPAQHDAIVAELERRGPGTARQFLNYLGTPRIGVTAAAINAGATSASLQRQQGQP